MRAAEPIDQVQTAAAMRDRVTVDLRGMRPQLQAQAARRQMTAAALVRHAVTAMLDDAPSDADDSGSTDGNCCTQVIKVTLRLPVAHAVVLASRARVADVSQGSYVARLIDGTPAQPPGPDHARAVAALMASTDRIAVLSADLNATWAAQPDKVVPEIGLMPFVVEKTWSPARSNDCRSRTAALTIGAMCVRTSSRAVLGVVDGDRVGTHVGQAQALQLLDALPASAQEEALAARA